MERAVPNSNRPIRFHPEVGFDRDDNFSKYPYSSWGKGAWLLDTRTLKYEILPEAPVGFHWPQGVAVGQDLYLFTGYIREPDERELDLLRGRGPDARDYWHPRNHAGRDVTSNRMFRLSRRSGQWKWQEMAPLRIGRFIPGAAVAGSAIVVVGGQASLGASFFAGDFYGVDINAVEAFDTAAAEPDWVDLPPIPWMGRESMATAAIGNNIYVFGGSYWNFSHAGKADTLTAALTKAGESLYKDKYKRHCGDAYVLNLDTKRWRKLPDLPFPGHGWEAGVYKKRYIIIVGGLKNRPVDHPYAYHGQIPEFSSVNFDVVVFDALEETYRILPTPLPPFPIHPAQRKRALPYEQVQKLDLSKGAFRLASEVALLGNKLYVTGGEVLSPYNVTDEVLIGTILEK